jgi:phosphohistidine phosphatase
MNLYVMRHAIAAEPDEATPDEQRALTEAGRKKLLKIARSLKKMGITLDLLLTSPYLRARQTAEVVAAQLKPGTVLESTALLPPGAAGVLVDEINARAPLQNVMVIGHEPFLGQFIGTLAAGEANLGITLKKAGVCKLAVETLSNKRCATLEWLLTPAQLVEM